MRKRGRRFAPALGPLYLRAADRLRTRIEELEWRPDIPMPNEASLAQEMGVSVGTMRKALGILEAEMLITRRQGRGTFVIEATFEAERDRFPGLFSVDLTLDAATTRMMTVRRAATAEEAARLELADPSRVIEIERVRRREGQFAVLERITVPAAVLAGLEEVDGLGEPLLFAVYRRDFHVVAASARETIVPVSADAQTAALLGIDQGVALLKVSRLATTSQGQPIEWCVRHVHIPLTDQPPASALRMPDAPRPPEPDGALGRERRPGAVATREPVGMEPECARSGPLAIL